MNNLSEKDIFKLIMKSLDEDNNDIFANNCRLVKNRGMYITFPEPFSDAKENSSSYDVFYNFILGKWKKSNNHDIKFTLWQRTRLWLKVKEVKEEIRIKNCGKQIDSLHGNKNISVEPYVLAMEMLGYKVECKNTITDKKNKK